MDKIYAIEENKAKEKLRLANKDDEKINSLKDPKNNPNDPFTISGSRLNTCTSMISGQGYNRGQNKMKNSHKYENF